jgi:hypothetical protein
MNKLPQIHVPDTSSITINNQETLEQATSILSQLNKNLDILTAHKEGKTLPLNAALKSIRADYKPLETQLTDAITSIKNSITTYVGKQIKEAAELQARILADGRTSLETKITKLAEVDNSGTDKVQTAQGSVSFVTVKKWRIKDESLIPRAFLIPNEDAIKQAMKEQSPIPGVEFYEEQSIRNYR